MASFMKSIEKDMHHYILAILLALFIVTDVKVPNTIDELVNTLLGKVIVIGGALALLFAHPLVGALGIVAAYRLISQANSSSVQRAPSYLSPRNPLPRPLASLPPSQSGLSATKQFPLTVEEEVIRKMLPVAAGGLPPATFKPVLDKLHNAAKISN